ncbi:unnamed protein product [Peronospora destructor]|uniref:Uncharacterized protein n=1 Tax=Peronospora destructor TaxID=86335 RepID=A0AAV0TSF6_9STRA|nr:unnamed protein product [Peronospora destructor]
MKRQSKRSAEYQSARADRQDQASEIDRSRTQLRTEESNCQVDNAHFLQQIEQLSDQLRGNTSHYLEELRALHRATTVQSRKEQSFLQGRILILTSQLEQTKSALAGANLQLSQKSSELVGAKTTLDNLSAQVDELKNQDNQVQTLQATNISLRNQVSQLRLVMTQLEKERDRAVEDHDSLRARIASTIASPPIIPPAPKSDETVSEKPTFISRPLVITQMCDLEVRNDVALVSASPSHHAKEKEVRALSVQVQKVVDPSPVRRL